MKAKNIYIIVFFIAGIFFQALCKAQVVKSYNKKQDRLIVDLSLGTLSIIPLSHNAVRIKFYVNSEPNIPELVFISKAQTPEFQVADLPSTIEIKLKNITVLLNKQTGNLSFANHSGKIFLSEVKGARKLIPDSIMGEPCFLVEQSFETSAEEYLLGLGQFQDGHYNLKGVTRRLMQVNSQIALPFIYSSKGYGLLWHQYGLTDFNPADNFIALEKQDSADSKRMAEVTTTSGTQKVAQDQSVYYGKFYVPEDGNYSVFLDLGDMGNRHYIAIDGKPCIDQSNFWLPPATSVLVNLKAGEHTLQVICKSTNTPSVSWRPVENKTTFRSPHAMLIDYIVFYGPSADSVIATYRKLSGNVPLLPLWAYGFWQCRERYTSASHLVETVKEFRKRKLPMDVIVQDWQYWGNRGWGVPQFDETNYPDPSRFIKEIHDLNAHFNISIWSNPDKNSEVGKMFVEKNLFIPNSKWLDYFNPETRKEYWRTLRDNLFVHGVDSWWMDATEPENDALHSTKTYIGLGDFYRLTYPLFVNQAVYEGQRNTTSYKRVCILTRSAFLGQQRYGTINWSGDIGGTWDAFRRQIVAGLNYTITGMPYWTTDIGGFFRPGRSQYTDEKYHELLIRWFQWGAFNPIFRIHGYMSETEPWKYGPQVENTMHKILNLRYRLIPYIYSEAWQVTSNGSTMMRPLIMDFANDTIAIRQPYEFMFGKNMLVTPVTEANARACKIYLPKGVHWYDFWTGEKLSGGQHITRETPIDIIPLYVKAGSILPIGPDVQYATEKKWDTLGIRIYPGADGEFILYEDEGDHYNYEKGMYSTIKFSWDDKNQTLTIHHRQGAFPGMMTTRKFEILKVNEKVKSVAYNGKKMHIKL